jgi:hypothetical protein
MMGAAKYFPPEEIQDIARNYRPYVLDAIKPGADKRRFLYLMRRESVEMIEYYLPKMDDKTKARALCTIKNLRGQD